MTVNTPRHPMYFMGYGPWLVLEECGSRTHNTYSAGHKSAGINNGKCICPRAVAIKAASDAAKRARAAANRPTGEQRSATRARGPEYINNMSQVPAAAMPDFSKGRCTKPGGKGLMDAAAIPGPGQGQRIKAAKWMCLKACVVRAECLAWIDKAEVPAGSWGGIYAGLTAKERGGAKA